MDYKLDMSSMLAIHQALRRDLERLGRIAARPDGDPARLLQAAAGWKQFKTFLVAHHTAEDQALWPPLREATAANPDQVALADALEEEHSVIEPLLSAIDAAAADPDDGHQAIGGIIDELIGKLSGHLRHEETEGFAPAGFERLVAAVWACEPDPDPQPPSPRARTSATGAHHQARRGVIAATIPAPRARPAPGVECRHTV